MAEPTSTPGARALAFTDDPNAEPQLFACIECGRTYSPLLGGVAAVPARHGNVTSYRNPNAARALAEACCAPGACEDCGATVASGELLCSPCTTTRLIERAEVLPPDGHEGAVWTPEIVHEHGIFPSLADLADYCRRAERPLPDYVFPCRAEPWDGIDIEAALDASLADFHGDALEHLSHIEALRDYITAWNGLQKVVAQRPNPRQVLDLRGWTLAPGREVAHG